MPQENEKSEKQRQRNRPITLVPLTFDEAVDRLLKAKPKSKKEKPKDSQETDDADKR